MFQSLRDLKFHGNVKRGIIAFLTDAGFKEEQNGVISSATNSGITIDIDEAVIRCRLCFGKQRWVFAAKIIGDVFGEEIVISTHSMDTISREHAMEWAKDMARTLAHLKS